jgi:hypothetical protein
MAYSEENDFWEMMKKLRGGASGASKAAGGVAGIAGMAADPTMGAASMGLNVVGAGADYLQGEADKRNAQRLANNQKSEDRQLDKIAMNYKMSQDDTAGKREGFNLFQNLVDQTDKDKGKRGKSAIMKAMGW